VQAGLTGHLVLSTIHSGVSAGAFTRLINMEIEPFMLAFERSWCDGNAADTAQLSGLFATV